MNNEDTLLRPMTPPPPPGQTNNNPIPSAAGSSNWGQRAALAAGGAVLGAGVGAASTVAAINLMDDNDAPEPEPTVDVVEEPVSAMPVAEVDDNASFAQAFADARAQVGPGGVFEWHGQVYGTYYETEWNQMSAAERAEFQSSVDYEGVLSGRATQHHDVAQHDGAAMSHTVHAEQVADVHVADLDHTDLNGDGSADEVAVVNIGGEQVIVVDVDGDGIADVVVADLDADGIIGEYEVAEITDEGLEMADIVDLDHTMASIVDEGIDYMNDIMTDIFEA